MVENAAREAVLNYNLQEGQKNNAREGERYSPRMTSDMTEQERYDKLKNLSLTVMASAKKNAVADAEEKYGTAIKDGTNLKATDRKKLFKKIGELFNVYTDYDNRDIDLTFTFSGENMRESISKQKRYYYSFMKMLSCFGDVIDSAIGIETHNRNEAGYKVDPTSKNVYVMVSAFQDGENITPVKLEIKEFSDKPNTLYVAIALDSIQKGKLSNKNSGIVTEGNTVSGVTQSAPPLIVSLADLFANVNPQDSSFLKYVPTQFLTEQQRAGEKYSSRTSSDSEYLSLAQNPEENREALSRMVENAAREAGYTRLFFHGSKKGGGFTVFRDWQYFTENREYAKRYANRENPGSLYETYVKMENPFDTRIPEVRELFEQARQEYGMGELQENGLPDWTDGYDIADYIDENDLPYDGIILDEGGDMVNGKPVSRGLSYVIRDSSQVKSADAVTYDDNGNVIPLSQRFDTGKEDIRYSARYAAAEENPEIANLVQRVLSGDFKANDKVYLGTVSSQNAARIQEITGINVDGFRVAIEARQIEHILNRHGIEESADHSMAQVSDISKIQYTLDNPDSITPAGKATDSPSFPSGLLSYP